MIVVGLGANLPTVYGSPLTTLTNVLGSMPRYGLSVARHSSWYETPAITPYAQPPFVNAVAIVETTMTAPDLLKTLHTIEAQFGRVRRKRWEERPVDLDLLDCRGMIIPPEVPMGVDAGIEALPLTLPHPGLDKRAFVLIPLAEVAPDWRHPVSGKGADALLAELVAGQGEAVLDGIQRLGVPVSAR